MVYVNGGIFSKVLHKKVKYIFFIFFIELIMLQHLRSLAKYFYTVTVKIIWFKILELLFK